MRKAYLSQPIRYLGENGTIYHVTIPFHTWANNKYLRNFNSRLKFSFLISSKHSALYIWQTIVSIWYCQWQYCNQITHHGCSKNIANRFRINSSFALETLCKTSSLQTNISSCMASAVHKTTVLWIVFRKQKLATSQSSWLVDLLQWKQPGS